MEDEEIEVFKFEYNGSYIIDTLIGNVVETARELIESSEKDEPVEIKITRQSMKQSEYESLPEFDGF